MVRDIVKEFREVHGEKYEYIFDKYINTKQRINIKCKIGHQFEMDVQSHLRGYGCSYCSGKKQTKSDIIKNLNEVHNGFYDYSKTDWVKKTDKVIIICPKHGEFKQELRVHERGFKCPKCSNKYVKTNTDFIEILKDKNQNITFSITEYINNKTNSKFICRSHGVIERTPSSIRNSNNIICLKCSYIKEDGKKFLEKCLKKYGNSYDYSLVEYVDGKTPVKIIDIESKKIFEQTPYHHLRGVQHNVYWDKRNNIDKFIQESDKIHDGKYKYDKSIYTGSKSKLKVICDIHGVFEQIPNNHLRGAGCPKCNRFNLKQNEVLNFIESDLEIKNVILNDRSILNGKELDIYIPDSNLAIEFNGLYWHSEIYKDKKYHLYKTNRCSDMGINLIHIWEDDWDNKVDICKSILRNKLSKSVDRIFARKCLIKEVSSKDTKAFLDQNHLQGNTRYKISIGLYYNNELVSIMTFGDLRGSLGQKSQKSKYELIRFCNKLNTNVVGGASKLMKYFIKTFNPLEVISYSDNSRYVGNLYKNLGFEFSHNSPPNYHYIINGIRKHRYGYTKHKLVKRGFNSDKTEHQIMLENKNYRIYDCGSKKWVFK